jgi:hypothetical protein
VIRADGIGMPELLDGIGNLILKKGVIPVKS